ncbi:stress-induced-phosphoprotein 1-like [Asbolus verrucosus]|uniref:Stress-induced-phosphoprotein 1 n=1 Tax=Asbolus verrucosus TaxID=1661398 RepID=A0A482W1L6_ASBVE|nr:stress-induced-phosphoprotein 1-like [Asbolus verrucosus]
MLQANPSLLGQKLQDPNILTTLSVLIGLDPGEEPMETEPVYTPPPRKPEPKPEPKKNSEPELPENKKLAKAEKEKGNEFYKKKAFEQAIQHYNKAIEYDPTDITFYNNLAAVYFEQKEFDKCIKECEKAIEIGRENRADFKLIAKSFLRIGNAYKKLKEYQNAKIYYEKSMSEHRTPEIKTLLSEIEKIIREEERKAYVNPELAEKEKEIGNELFKKGEYATAVKHYTEAIKRNPEDAKLYSNRAACYTKLAAFDLGLKDCEKCVELDPKFIKGWIRKGHILQGMQQPSKAISAFQKALEIDPNNAEALNGYRACSIETASGSGDPEKIRQRAMGDPEVQSILRDPAMRMILEQMQNDPRALQDHLKNPDIAAKIQKLLESGLIAIH